MLKTTTMIFCGGAPLDKVAEKQLIEMGAPLIQLYGT
jgi:long-subunit acyl-CoA synthetase (AMP-forming)